MTYHDCDENEPVTVTSLNKSEVEDEVRKRSNITDSDSTRKRAPFSKRSSVTENIKRSTLDTLDFVTAKGYFQQLSPRTKAAILLLVLMVVSTSLHAPSTDGGDDANGTFRQKNNGDKGGIKDNKASNAAFLPPVDMEPISEVETCLDVCGNRNTQRQEKYGGDLLNPQDVLQLAKAARDKTIAALKVDYGTYFEDIFVKKSPSSYYGMTGVTEDGPSRDRLKRKLKLKVLNMMQTIRALEENVAGCNCLKNPDDQKGSPQGDKKASVPPEFYGKYVFANGGHSQAAGHGNMYSESYTAYFEKDIKDIMGAIGIKFEGRNYAMGAMKASPFISICSKEIFGTDVDFLSWNFGMTDKWHDTSSFYAYRGALSPGRPALVYIDGSGNANLEGRAFEDEGLAVFKTDIGAVPTVARGTNNKLPDSAPGGIPLKDEELEKLPPYLRALYCNGNLQGKPLCDSRKWSCTMGDIQNGKQCDCPSVPKRTGWHMGFKMHSLQGRLLSLPFLEIFMEGLEEIAHSDKDTQALREELQISEDQEFEAFKARPVFDAVSFPRYSSIYNDTELFQTFFKGDSVCRTSLVPSQTRYLGISTNSDKVGGPAPGWEETYDVGIPLHINKGGVYTYDEGHEAIPGIVQQTSKIGLRRDNPEWRKYCTQATVVDYKDWLYGPLKDGKTMLIFPNEKERAYYGYDPSKFKGYLGLVPTLFGEKGRDIPMAKFETNVRVTVNGKKVGKFRPVNSMVILEDESGSLKWEPNENNEYLIEFEPFGEIDGIPAADKHLRLYGAVVY